MNLEKFCSKDGTRFNIEAPFSKGEWTYATNGHIAIRIPRNDTTENKDAPDVEKIFTDAIKGAEPAWLDLPPFKLQRKSCSNCKGTGFMIEDKKKYEFVSCSKDFPGAEPCEDCEDGMILSGTGRIKGTKGFVTFAAKYLDILKDLPGIKIAVFGEMEPARFKFNGGEGLLMPMRA